MHGDCAPSESGLILFVVNADARIGVGHAMRLLALAQELINRGFHVQVLGRLEVDLVVRSYADAAITVEAAPGAPQELVAYALANHAAAVVFDGYEFGPTWGQALQAAHIVTMSLVDGEFSADQVADLYLDQNPGSRARDVASHQEALAGARYTLFRDDVLAGRRDANELLPFGVPPRVLAVFGGSDPMGAAPVITPLILAAAARAGHGIELTVITPDDGWAASVRAQCSAQEKLITSPPVSDLMHRALASDFVVTASGSSVWELLALGVPLGLVCVADNQSLGYDLVAEENLGAPIGHLSDIREDKAAADHAVDVITRALLEPDVARERAIRGQALLDGQGRARVADTLLALIAKRRGNESSPGVVTPAE